MFWKKKKIEDPVKVVESIDLDIKFIKEVLSGLNLLDVKNLMELSQITADKANKEEFERVMKLLEPVITKAVKEGKFRGELPCTAKEVDVFPYMLMDKMYKSIGLLVRVDSDSWYATFDPKRKKPKKPKYKYTFALVNLKDVQGNK